MDNKSKSVWIVEKGKSFLNNKRLPNLRLNSDVSSELEYLLSTNSDIQDIKSYMIPILRNYQATMTCFDCYDTKQKTSFYKLTELIISLTEKIVTFLDSTGTSAEWKELLGEIKSYATALKKLSEKEGSTNLERRRNSAYTEIESFVHLHKDYENPYLHSFFSDFSRISFSSAFRRLQDKAQVFPLEKYDYARTRLTHTIEVTGIAMQLGNLCGQKLYHSNNRYKKEFAFLFEKCLNCSALLHDLGNPPYGHFGEDTIKDFFQNFWDRKEVVLYKEARISMCKVSKLDKGSLSKSVLEQMKGDFTCFDGNAQSLRVASKTQQYKVGSSVVSSLDLTAAVLGSIIKYPCNSISGKIHQKFGYFYSENDTIKKLTHMGVYFKGIRNPFAMLLEASDDISYVTSDLDDAVKKGALSHEAFDSELIKFENETSNLSFTSSTFCNNFRKYYQENINKGVISAFEYTMQRMTNDLRIKLIGEVVSLFCKHADTIFDKGIYYLNKKDANCIMPPQGAWLLGECNELLECVPSAQLISWIKKILFKKHIYKDINILRNELAGHHIISFLLEQFTEAVLCLDFNKNESGNFLLSNPKRQGKKYFRQEKIFELISKNFVDVFTNETQNIDVNSFQHIYYRLRLVVDYVSGMTDCYALEICNTLKGM